MPFFKTAIFKKIKGCVFLQVYTPNSKKNHDRYKNINIRKRVCLFTSEGSVTIEAAITVSLLMFLMILVESFLLVLNTEITIQENMNNIVTKVSKNQYYIEVIDELSNKSDSLKKAKAAIGEKLQDNEMIGELITGGITSGYLYSKLYKEIHGSLLKDNSICKITGLNAFPSKISSGEVDMIVQYYISLPLVKRRLEINQRALVRDWSGYDITEKSKTVYITKTGKVYHTTRNCRHLIINIRKELYVDIEAKRNLNGEKYTKCAICMKKESDIGVYVFVTDEGNRFHVGLDCSGLKRNLITTDISNVGERKLCSDCGNGG